MSNDTISIAVSKGRIYKEALPLLAHAGITPTDDPDKCRKLILDTNDPQVKLIIIRATDVPVFVNYGAADLGITGKDTLMEYDGSELYEPLDLKISPCKLMVAGPKGEDFLNTKGRLRVATKYVNTTRRYFTERGIQVDIIKLYGSMELAPMVSLSDCIVDLVDTGNTLKANGLEATDHVCDISSRLIVNKASMKMKHDRIKQIISQISEAVNK
ncbi:MAG: ATP phosphoribosyltransferase [Sulfuriflexus sp.]|nr:ATP phosphoribosyltransferase [Sulfuriflexus sp.]